MHDNEIRTEVIKGSNLILTTTRYCNFNFECRDHYSEGNEPLRKHFFSLRS
jgi:hypothetical protein